MKMQTWKLDITNGRTVLTTSAGIAVDLTETDHETSLEFYQNYALDIDIQNHKHTLDCQHCNRKVLCYNNFQEAVLCEKCIRVPQLATEIAESVANPWFDLLCEIINPKLRK